MKLMTKLVVVLIVLVAVVSGQRSSNIVFQDVLQWPTTDITGAKWYCYDYDSTVRVSDWSGIMCGTILPEPNWMTYWAEVGLDWGLPQAGPGDHFVTFGSFDTAYFNSPGSYNTNANHTGFYHLYSDELYDFSYNFFWADTLRAMPYPDASTFRQDSVKLVVQNPPQTPGMTISSYDVLGYEFYADTTGTGTPGSPWVYVGFAPVNGGAGNMTSFTYWPPDVFGFGEWDVYHAYYLAAGPDSLYPSDYMSHNSNLLTGIGVAEEVGSKPALFSVCAAPTVFTQRTRFTYTLSKATAVKLGIYDASGQLIRTLLNETRPAGTYTVEFDGASLPSGVYFYDLRTDENRHTGRLTIVH